MRYAQPAYSVQQVNVAGKKLSALEGRVSDLRHAINVMDNWRASHAYPAQAFYVTLKRRACQINKHSLVAQRIKRLPSILAKLMREKEMKLSQMQDIGGCRAVLQTLDQVRQLEKEYASIRWKHERLKSKDYISYPKPSGYRGIHLRFKFCADGQKAAFNGLKIELQLRTTLQHQWATAVETTDIFTRQALKSSQGKKEWQRFFALMGSVLAMREGCPLVPGTPTTLDELLNEIRELDAEHHIVNTFHGYTAIMPRIENKKDAKYYLVTLDPINKQVRIKGFKSTESQEANKEYTEKESSLGNDSPSQIVLISVSSVRDLKQVYPNYFMDTTLFLKEVIALIGT